MKKPNTLRGFTLIEMMITVAIIGILAAIAYPNYSQYVERSNRNDAKAVLLEASQYMERWFTQSRTYSTAVLPTGLTQSPKEGTARYNITISVVSPTTYTLDAAPINAVKKCKNLTLTHLGVKGSAQDTVDECWSR
jgi:type IV pilus assembly protein PilE